MSTYYLDRATALKLIMRMLDTCTNENLGNILEELDESSLRNFDVCEQLLDESNEERTIRDVGDW